MQRDELTAAYLDALGLERQPPSREQLDALVRRHVATFAFSSIGPRLGDDLPLDPGELLDRIVVRRRGGYCFEQNGLLAEVLGELGYDPTLLLGRVLLSGNPHPGLTHRINVVTLEGTPYVVDVGFGAPGPRQVVPMGGAEVGPPWRRFRVVEARPGHWHLQTCTGADWQSLYRFELLEYGPSDCEVGHFYSHRHPQAGFVNTLVASLVLEDEVRSLRNLDYWVLTPEGERRTVVEDADQLHRLLVHDLDVRVSRAEAQRLFDPLAADRPA